MKARQVAACVLAAGALVAGCQSTVTGTPRTNAGSPTEPSFPTARPTRSTPPPPTSPKVPTSRAPTTPTPGSATLVPQDGWVFIETKSRKTRCQINADEVDCEAPFTNPPIVGGSPANGLRLGADGHVEWIVGNLGDIPVVTIGYQTYTAEGWTIVATEAGTRFTNSRTSHGMFLSLEKVEFY